MDAKLETPLVRGRRGRDFRLRLHVRGGNGPIRCRDKTLKIIAVDEWHELLGSKRGVQVELALSRISALLTSSYRGGTSTLQIWGISATIGNLEEAARVLLAPLIYKKVSPVGGDLEGAIIKGKSFQANRSAFRYSA